MKISIGSVAASVKPGVLTRDGASQSSKDQVELGNHEILAMSFLPTAIPEE